MGLKTLDTANRLWESEESILDFKLWLSAVKECKESSWMSFIYSSYQFSECTGTSGHTLGLSSNRSSWAGVLWFQLTSMMTILVVPLSGQELF